MTARSVGARLGLALSGLAVLAALALPRVAQAQPSAQLTGTYVRWVAVSGTGVMVANDAPTSTPCSASCVCDATASWCIAVRSMAYSELGTDETASCNAFTTRSLETFSLAVTRASTHVVRGTNRFSAHDLRRVDGASVVGRTIRWAGILEDEIDAPVLRIDSEWSYLPDERVVRLRMTVRNLEATPVTDVYVLRDADPSFAGRCPLSGAGPMETANDVLRQPGASGADALAVALAGDAATEGGVFVLGFGAHDARARASTGGLAHTDATGLWRAPTDTNGALANESVDLVFHESEIAPGDATTFEMFYVWGTSVADVEARFDLAGTDSTCAAVADESACSSPSGAAGTCHGGRCCTGCWDAARGRCEEGTSAATCGALGAACGRCDDGDACTSDVCALGRCSYPFAGAETLCEDGHFCTGGDHCDGAGRCVPGAAEVCDDGAACTSDRCDDAGARCMHDLAPATCLVGGECVAAGTRASGYPCLVCDPIATPSDWSPVPAGEPCADAYCTLGALFRGGSCDGAGACPTAVAQACPTGACASTLACEIPCATSGCPDGQRCASDGRCVRLRDDGASCVADAECRGGHCADGVCCESECRGTCEACDLPTHEGRCVAVPDGTDPALECPGVAACDGARACETIARDAGPDAFVPSDAAPTPPTPPRSRADCTCTAAGTSGGAGGLALAALAGVLLARRRRRAVATIAALGLTLVPLVARATTLDADLGFSFEIDDRVTGGTGALVGGTPGAYDFAYRLRIGASEYALVPASRATRSAGGRQIDLPALAVGTSGLLAERHVYVPSTGASWARYVDVIVNPTSAPITASVTIVSDLGSNDATRLVASSSGDASVSTTDTWLVTDDAEGVGAPALAHVFAGAGAPTPPVFVGLAADQLAYVFDVTVPARGRVALMHFAVQATSEAEAEADARALAVLPLAARAYADAWARAILNWDVGAPDACETSGEGSACTAWSGGAGLCRAAACCAGCWDGARCLDGEAAGTCGVGGGACASCDDGQACTEDRCTSGLCEHPSASAGTDCEDGAFCTSGDACDGAGHCAPGTRSPCDDRASCTTDACDESTRQCAHTFTNGCWIGGECVIEGVRHPAYPCLTCDPTVDAADWTPLPTGTSCAAPYCEEGHAFPEGLCDATGACVVRAPAACASGLCSADRVHCEEPCTETSCPSGQRCDALHHCVPIRGLGSNCATGADCDSGFCADGVCCESACAGVCVSCDLSGRSGACRAYGAGTDPENECGRGRACDGRSACVGPDAGMTASDAATFDAGAPDAATPAPGPSSGFGCRAAPRGQPGLALFGLLGALAVCRRRRAW
ncbi:MAG: hypothetical protein U0234_16425 [Sandaracinus sp.]